MPDRRTEFGEVVPQGAVNAKRLIAIVEDASSGLPDEARATLLVLIETKVRLDDQVLKLDAEIRRRAKENEVARRLMTIPGIGPLIATALVALAPPAETFRKSRDFAAWLGLVPRQHSRDQSISSRLSSSWLSSSRPMVVSKSVAMARST